MVSRPLDHLIHPLCHLKLRFRRDGAVAGADDIRGRYLRGIEGTASMAVASKTMGRSRGTIVATRSGALSA